MGQVRDPKSVLAKRICQCGKTPGNIFRGESSRGGCAQIYLLFTALLWLSLGVHNTSYHPLSVARVIVKTSGPLQQHNSKLQYARGDFCKV